MDGDELDSADDDNLTDEEIADDGSSVRESLPTKPLSDRGLESVAALTSSAESSEAVENIIDGLSQHEAELDDDSDIDERVHMAVPLITGILPEELEGGLVSALDELAPRLASTPRLQDKALRVVFSVGIDVVVMDAESSCLAGRLQLRPEDMLSSNDTDDVWGVFMVPDMNEVCRDLDDGDDDDDIEDDDKDGHQHHHGDSKPKHSPLR